MSAGFLGAKAPEAFAALADCLFPVVLRSSESVLSVAAAGQYCMELCFFRAIERGIGRVTERVSGSAMERAEYGMERDSSRKRLLLGIGIAGNLALLCFFKYFNAISAGWSQMKGLEDPILQLALPLGISFLPFSRLDFWQMLIKERLGRAA